MKVLISEHFREGHYYPFVAPLLPLLARLVDQVIVAVTPAGYASAEFKAILAPLAGSATFLPLLPEASPWLPMSERKILYDALRSVVRETRPDYVLLPTADGQITGLSVTRILRGGVARGDVPCEGAVHFGSGATPVGVARTLRDWLQMSSLASSGLRRTHIVNVLFYERLIKRFPRQPFSVVPTPIRANPRLTKTDSRRLLGIPEDGRYIGLAGSLDTRKAIPQLLQAVRAATPHKTDRVLLAGWMNAQHTRTIEQHFADLLSDGRLVLLPGFLSPDRYQQALTAMDVVCTPYPGFTGLSASLLEAVAAARPILANDTGWMRYMVQRFELGWTCDVMNPADFASAIRTALDNCDGYEETAAIRRLMQFNSTDNYARSWVQGLPGGAALPVVAWHDVALPARQAQG